MYRARQLTSDQRYATGGFTLIELLIVVVIIGLLSIIAIPSYNNYVRRGKLIEGQAALSDYRVKIEQYYQDNRNYGAAGGACGATAPTSKYFTLSCTAATAQTFTATAASAAGQGLGAAGDYTYTINELNAKATTKFDGAGVAKACWLVKGSEC